MYNGRKSYGNSEQGFIKKFVARFIVGQNDTDNDNFLMSDDIRQYVLLGMLVILLALLILSFIVEGFPTW